MGTDKFIYEDVYGLTLDKSIMEIKRISQKIKIDDLLNLNNIDRIILLKRIIETMEIPIPLIEE